ncbi:hypothetical protein D3C78_1408560 [compost metagenome]
MPNCSAMRISPSAWATVGATRLPAIRLKPRPMAAARGAKGRRLDMINSPAIQKGASPWMVVRYSLRRRWLGHPAARWISERLSQNTRSWGCH